MSTIQERNFYIIIGFSRFFHVLLAKGDKSILITKANLQLLAESLSLGNNLNCWGTSSTELHNICHVLQLIANQAHYCFSFLFLSTKYISGFIVVPKHKQKTL